jgi:diguanylate cyclase (GGDEF)-like protein/PAS domain S-box-containing protein
LQSRTINDRAALRAFVFDSLEEQIAVIDEAGVILDVNSAWTRFGIENGLSPDFDCVGCNYLEVVQHSFSAGDERAREAAQGISDVLSGRRAGFYHEYPCHTPTERRWFMMRVSRLKGELGRMFVISHHDITQRKLAEERAEHMALHDSLTGLANRRCFGEFLGLELRRSVRERSAISLVLIDVDHFKDYNDERGHLAGDQCLAAVARVLPAFARRPGDLAARLGGDEFAVILGKTEIAESRMIADAIREAVSELKLVFGGSRQVTVSVGVACAIPGEQQTQDLLFQEADKALYAAKAAGRNRVVLAPSG